MVQSPNLALFEVWEPRNLIKAGLPVELPRHQPVTKSVAQVSAEPRLHSTCDGQAERFHVRRRD